MRNIARITFFLLVLGSVWGRSTETVYLSGHGSEDAVAWDFYCTEGRNSGVWTTIPVPSCWEVQGFGNYDYGVLSRPDERHPHRPPLSAERGKYRHRFFAEERWRGAVVRLIFEGVMTDAAVKLNGRSAGAVHQGGFYRFTHDVTELLRYGESNLLEVEVAKHSANESVNRAERYADYWNFGGIFRPVRLEILPARHIERVAIDAREDGRFEAQVHLRGQTVGTELGLRILNAQGEEVGLAPNLPITNVDGPVLVTVSIKNPDTWSAETPHLYWAEFSLRVGPGGGTEHVVRQRFGFRTFEVRPGEGFYLNGRKITFKGVNRHSFWADTGRTLSTRRLREDVQLMKEANLNAVRMSHYPPDSEFLDLCDEAGLYVINELAGWQQAYDTPTGRRLIGQMVTRDVNHPSVLFWANGNEGGENPENDDEFARHDPQRRPVLHPWALSFRGINTYHYREMSDTERYVEGPDIFMPTEFLHGLFDGGHGAGLEDYWKLLGEKPHAAGGFLWCWMDEAVVRADQGGRIDANRDLGPDGMLGPRHEKEGSYFAVRDIWSPVQVEWDALPDDFSGRLPVRNRYDFLNLSSVTFEWRLVSYAPPGARMFHRNLLGFGRIAGPDVAARGEGELTLPLPTDWREADVLLLTALDRQGRALRTWSWRWKNGAAVLGHATPAEGAVVLSEDERLATITAGRNTFHFERAAGRLAGMERDGRAVSLGAGPRLAAYRRNERAFLPVAPSSGSLTEFSARLEGGVAVVTARHTAGVRETRWTISPDGDARLDYRFEGPGEVDLLGVDFDYPEEKMRSKQWLGAGPYRVWQNRLRGGSFELWENDYNDTIPGVSWDFPEFKGWFSRWEWMAFTTTEGRFALLNDGGHPFIGVYSPRDGRNNPVLTLPRLGIGVYQVIPAIGTKQSLPDALGPQGRPRHVTGEVRGSMIVRLLDLP